MRAGAFDAVRLDVFQHLFASVCEEMGAILMRSSFSPNVRERRDLSCALFDARGRMIGQAEHLAHAAVQAGFSRLATRGGRESSRWPRRL